MLFDDVRSMSLFTGIDDAQLQQLVDAGVEQNFRVGDVLFVEGDAASTWWLLLDGTVELVRHVGREDVVLGAMDAPGRWAGGFRAWDDNGVYLATGRALTPTRMFVVPAVSLHDLANEWFPFGVHMIKGLIQTARRIEAGARQRESLVALGTLAAGLAHEINNPAAAATRAVESLESACDSLLGSLSQLAQCAISADQFTALDTLRRSLRRPDAERSALVIADLEDTVGDWLAARSVADAWRLAPTLVEAGADVAWCDQVAAVVPAAALAPALTWVTSTCSAMGLLSEVRESTRRVSDLVASVKSYSQMDRSSVQRTDVREGLESTLVMLGHKLRGGFEVVRNFGDVPEIEAVAGELNQVWTNLIDNAIDAMEGSGTLTVSTAVVERSIVVEIGDTGPGMPTEVQARAFEPFFTTKGVGKGTGLGLDISRRIIVERHNGTISIESAPGATTIRVTVPVT